MRLVATSIVALEVFFLKLKLSTLTGRAGGFCHAEATIKTALPEAAPSVAFYLSLRCSQCWFATLQEVLLADWHDVWHSPHPPLVFDSAMSLVVIVLILFIVIPPFS